MRPSITRTNGNAVALDSVKNEMEADYEAQQPGSKIGTLPTDERKSNKILEIRIDPPNESDRGIRTTFIDVPKNL
jgi:hypothetical protein